MLSLRRLKACKLQQVCKIWKCKNSTIELPQPLSKTTLGQASYIKNFRCDESDPIHHTIKDEGRFYTIPTEHYSRMVSKDWNTYLLTHQHVKHSSVFNEHCVMVRKPGLQIVDLLKRTNYDMPVNRYLLYGKTGSGKSLTLQYVLHYGMCRKWLILPTYNTWSWSNYRHRFKPDQRQELIASQWNPERIDQPENAANWLKTFRLMNQSLLNEIHVTKDYKWSKHEQTPNGSSIAQLVDTGIARIKIASDVIGAIVREVMVQEANTFPRTLVVLDCVNAIFEKTNLKMQYGVYATPEQLSFFHHMKKLMSNRWKNGAVVTALNTTGLREVQERESTLLGEHPYDSLTQQGFDCLDPHIPIHVPQYSDCEMLSQLAYYADRKWLNGQSLSEAREAELMQLSCNNPRDLSILCSYAY